MKKVLILVLSSDFPPYDQMIQTSLKTWEMLEVEGVDTVFYCGKSNKKNSEKVIYLPVDNRLHDMGSKSILAYEWALQNKQFDYVARVNASCYVDKTKLIEFVQQLSETNVFAGTVAESQNGFKYLWGGCQFIISKDVLQKIVDNQKLWRHDLMEDEAMSLVVSALEIPFFEGKSGAIDKMPEGWRIISYGGESMSFTDFSEIVKLGHHFYRVKCDGKRDVDAFVMKELFKVLQ